MLECVSEFSWRMASEMRGNSENENLTNAAQVVDIEMGKTDATVAPALPPAANNTETVTPPKPVPPAGKYEYPTRPLSKYAMSRSCPPPPCYKKKIGRFYVFCEDKEGRPILMLV